MRSKWFLPTAVALAIAVPAMTAAAQTLSYINLLQFDLVSYRSQATSGMLDDDLEMVSNAARLLEVDGNRLYTTFANLSEPATLGDNLITYGIDETGNPAAGDTYDTGSYLGGWIGRYRQDSEYVFSVFYQRNHNRSMFEDLEDGSLGSSAGVSVDAESRGTRTVELDNGAGGNDDDDRIADERDTYTWDLMRYDDRSAMNLDFGAAREISRDLSVGGRLLWEKDVLDRFAEGRTEFESEEKFAAEGDLVSTGRTVTVYSGDGEEAYKYSEMGISLDADYHPWSNQSVNLRIDVFGSNLRNPGDLGAPLLATRSELGAAARIQGPPTPFDPTNGLGVAYVEETTYAPVSDPDGDFPDDAVGELSGSHENSRLVTRSFGLGSYGIQRASLGSTSAPVFSIDDERTGVGFALLAEIDREFAGGNSRVWAGMTHRPYDLAATVVQKDREINRFWWNAGDADHEATQTVKDDTYTTTRDGDVKARAWELGHKWHRDLNENVRLGLGLIVTRSTHSSEYTQTTVAEKRVAFDDGDGSNASNTLYSADLDENGDPDEIAAYNEGSMIETTTSSGDVKHDDHATTTRLPVGVKLSWGDGGKYAFLLGATHNVNNRTVETTYRGSDPDDLLGGIPGGGTSRTVVVTSYADNTGDVNGTTYSDEDDNKDVSVTDKSRWNTTTYQYGFEYRPNDSVQINVNGFFDTNGGNTSNPGAPPDYNSGGSIVDTDFWRNLAISMTFFFM